MSPLPTSARPASCPRSSATPSWTASRSVRPAAGPSRRWTGRPGSPDSALWARVPGHLTPSAATLAIFGDYVSGAVSQPLGRRAMGRSLDNTLRMVQLKPTEWVLCDIRMHALVGGYGQGIAFLWSEDGDLLATASQSIGVRLWPEDAELPRLNGGATFDRPPDGETVLHGPPRDHPRTAATVRQGHWLVAIVVAGGPGRRRTDLRSFWRPPPPRRDAPSRSTATPTQGHDARRPPLRPPTTTTTTPRRAGVQRRAGDRRRRLRDARLPGPAPDGHSRHQRGRRGQPAVVRRRIDPADAEVRRPARRGRHRRAGHQRPHHGLATSTT